MDELNENGHFIPPLKISLNQVKQILSINFSVCYFYDDNVKINNKLSYNKSELVTHILESNKCVENLKSWTLMDGFLINGYPTMVNGLISQHTFPRRIKGAQPPWISKIYGFWAQTGAVHPFKRKKVKPLLDKFLNMPLTFFCSRDCTRNFKWSFIFKGTYPIYRCTLLFWSKIRLVLSLNKCLWETCHSNL